MQWLQEEGSFSTSLGCYTLLGLLSIPPIWTLILHKMRRQEAQQEVFLESARKVGKKKGWPGLMSRLSPAAPGFLLSDNMRAALIAVAASLHMAALRGPGTT